MTLPPGNAGVSSEAAHAKIASAPEDKPWQLREFIVAELDGNFIGIFYDFHPRGLKQKG